MVAASFLALMRPAGVLVGLHHSRPQAAGSEGWCSRRLPVRPLPLGFAGSTLFWSVPAAGLLALFRLAAQRGRSGRRRWRAVGVAAALLLAGAALNVGVALGLWTRWQFGPEPLALHASWFRAGAPMDQNATSLRGPLSVWPAAVPEGWPAGPRWIGWLGSAPGVRAYEYTGRGIPDAAGMWMHVSWGGDAWDPHQEVRLVQIGWPLPCLQSEELIEVQGRREVDQNASAGTPWPDLWRPTAPLRRTAGLLATTLPGAPQPTTGSDLTPYVPIRPLALGMTVNTLLFAAAAAAISMGPGAVRTIVRRRRGACLACGYDLRDLAICPECGTGRS